MNSYLLYYLSLYEGIYMYKEFLYYIYIPSLLLQVL